MSFRRSIFPRFRKSVVHSTPIKTPTVYIAPYDDPFINMWMVDKYNYLKFVDMEIELFTPGTDEYFLSLMKDITRYLEEIYINKLYDTPSSYIIEISQFNLFLEYCKDLSSETIIKFLSMLKTHLDIKKKNILPKSRTDQLLELKCIYLY